jgi:hypothetical protein|nr:MAG TPA: hypothetical protein [Caudoviricetes sp.]
MFKQLRERANDLLTAYRLLRKGGARGMAHLLALNIIMGEITFSEVHKSMRKAVRKQLKIAGFPELEFMTLEQLKARESETEGEPQQ